MNCKNRFIGFAVAAFGAGVLLATFLPCYVMACFLAFLIVAAGVVLMKG